MKIGELAAATDTSVDTLRFYEREGLFPAPTRSSGNYRIYDDTHVARVAFIRRCRTLDMNLEEIRALLDFMSSPDESCEEVNTLLDEHIEHVSSRIRELQSLDKQLRALRKMCVTARDNGQCGILNGLSIGQKGTQPRSMSHVGRSHNHPPAAEVKRGKQAARR